MKKFGFFALLAAGLLLGACSSEINDENPKGEDYTDGAYIGISLQLPSTASATRANEDFDDGEEDEFAVKNATLYLFQGTTEAAATYMAHYSIGTDFTTDPAANITKSYCEATKISTEVAHDIKNATGNVYAYVIVNHNGLIPAMDESVTFADFSKWEFDKFGSPIAAAKAIDTNNGLLMTSSPICVEKGGDAAAPTDAKKYTTLIEIDKDKIYADDKDAKKNPAACIYVERAAAKITVSQKTTVTTLEGTEVAVAFQGWQIINYEPKFYNTRQIDATWGDLATDAAEDDNDFPLWKGVSATNKYRFVSGVAFGPQVPGAGDHTTGFRTYFAKDLQYGSDATLAKTVADEDGAWIGPGKHGYTTENTFDVAHMTQANTTHVTLKYKIGTGSFYTLNGGNDMYAYDAIKTKVATSIFYLPAVSNALTAAVAEVAALDHDHEYKGEIVVDFTEPDASKDGVTYTASFTITSTDGGTKDEDDATTNGPAVTAAINAAKASFSISFYKDGISYYNVRIKHFGDYETPWNSTKPFATVTPGETVAEIYGVGETPADKSAERFLGRYGVVRDNWYKLEVSGVKHIGTAEPVDVKDLVTIPDDEIENYISIHVHILPWVLRNQELIL